MEIGKWLEKYGESIYATRGGPFKPGKWGASTRKGNRIYLHVLQWTEGGISLPAIPAKITQTRTLTKSNVMVKQSEDGIRLEIKEPNSIEVDSVVVLEIDKKAGELQAVEVSGK